MLDVLYVLGTIAFFAAMAAYGRGCAALGREEGEEEHRA
jgi:hypothetical protein